MNNLQYLSSQEKLIKTEISLRKQRGVESLSCTLKTNESLSTYTDSKLPLKVKGRMLGVGRFKEKFYTKEELKKAVDRHKGKKIPIKLDHKIFEAGATIGGVDLLYWDESEQSIWYEGHINNHTHAMNVLDGLHTSVSASIDSVKSYDSSYGIVGLDLDFPELSVVHAGQYPGNTITPVI